MKEQKMEENNKIKFNRERVTEQLQKRHKERQINLENLQEIKNKETSKSEGVDYFENVFDCKIDEIENDLNSLESGMDVTTLGITFNKINNTIQELQKYLSNSTIFLTDYKIKKCQNQINEIQFKSNEIRNKLIPKKKFGFRKKILLNSTDILPSAEDNKLKEKETNNEIKQKQIKQFNWTLSNDCNKVFNLEEDLINHQDVTISKLNDCIVFLHGHPGSVQVSNLNNCILISGPISRSFFGENCIDCKFIVACQQLRLHSSTSCHLYLHVTCRAIIEDCNKILVSPYNYTYPRLNIDFDKSGLDKEKNNWSDIGDFNWLSPDKPSPHWKKMNDQFLISDWNEFIEKFKLQYNLI